MKVYILISTENTDGCYETLVSPYFSEGPAREEMEAAFAKVVQEIQFDTSVEDEDHNCIRMNRFFSIEDGLNYYSWTIEEHEVKDRFVE